MHAQQHEARPRSASTQHLKRAVRCCCATLRCGTAAGPRTSPPLSELLADTTAPLPAPAALPSRLACDAAPHQQLARPQMRAGGRSGAQIATACRMRGAEVRGMRCCCHMGLEPYRTNPLPTEGSYLRAAGRALRASRCGAGTAAACFERRAQVRVARRPLCIAHSVRHRTRQQPGMELQESA